MEINYTNERLFILSDEQKVDISKLQYYDFYFHLVRPDFLQVPLINESVKDFWTIFYYKEIPIINPENAIIFALRHYLMESLMKQPKLFRLKNATVGSYSKAMFTAAAALNIYLDFLRDVLEALPQKEVDFFWKHAKNSKLLYTNESTNNNTYPHQLARIETKMMKDLKYAINQNQELFESKLQNVIRLVDQLNLIEQEIF